PPPPNPPPFPYTTLFRSPEIVGHIEVRNAIIVVVAPGARKAVAVVIHVQPCGFCPVQKSAMPFVVKQKVRRAVPRVKIRRGIMILVKSHIIAVEAKINVEPSVAIVVRNGGMRERPLRRLHKLEGIALE